MKRIVLGSGILLFAVLSTPAQTAEGPQFEVASVKPAAPSPDGRMRIMMRGGPGSPDPGQIHYENVSLKDVLTNAFGVKRYQISGPVWLDSQRFDIVAKLPENATKETFKLMLQNLLKERFGMAFHRDSKDLPMYALLVAKGGPKLKASSEDTAPKDPAPTGGPSASAPPPPPPGGGPGRGGPPPLGKDGFPVLAKGSPRGSTMIMLGPNGHLRLTTVGQTMSGFTDMLANQVDRPVVDMTELTGRYDINLEFAVEGKFGPGPGGPPPPDGGSDASPLAASDSEGPNIVTAVQDLGLKLEARKGPVEIIVIDRIEKTPTEN